MMETQVTLKQQENTEGIWYLIRRHGQGDWMPFTQLRRAKPQEGFEVVGPFESFEKAIETLQTLVKKNF